MDEGGALSTSHLYHELPLLVAYPSQLYLYFVQFITVLRIVGTHNDAHKMMLGYHALLGEASR